MLAIIFHYVTVLLPVWPGGDEPALQCGRERDRRWFFRGWDPQRIGNPRYIRRLVGATALPAQRFEARWFHFGFTWFYPNRPAAKPWPCQQSRQPAAMEWPAWRDVRTRGCMVGGWYCLKFGFTCFYPSLGLTLGGGAVGKGDDTAPDGAKIAFWVGDYNYAAPTGAGKRRRFGMIWHEHQHVHWIVILVLAGFTGSPPREGRRLNSSRIEYGMVFRGLTWPNGRLVNG